MLLEFEAMKTALKFLTDVRNVLVEINHELSLTVDLVKELESIKSAEELKVIADHLEGTNIRLREISTALSKAE